jgi:hypothetical protein
MTQAQTSPQTPDMPYPGGTLQAGDGGPAQTHLPCRLHVPAQSPWPRRRGTDSPVARELCQPRAEADVEAVTESNLSLRLSARIPA